MAKYRKKPVIIEAEQWFPGKEVAGVINNPFKPTGTFHDRFLDHPDIYVETLEGKMAVYPGDYIITGVKGEKYPCREAIFNLTYEPLD